MQWKKIQYYWQKHKIIKSHEKCNGKHPLASNNQILGGREKVPGVPTCVWGALHVEGLPGLVHWLLVWGGFFSSPSSPSSFIIITFHWQLWHFFISDTNNSFHLFKCFPPMCRKRQTSQSCRKMFDCFFYKSDKVSQFQAGCAKSFFRAGCAKTLLTNEPAGGHRPQFLWSSSSFDGHRQNHHHHHHHHLIIIVDIIIIIWLSLLTSSSPRFWCAEDIAKAEIAIY